MYLYSLWWYVKKQNWKKIKTPSIDKLLQYNFFSSFLITNYYLFIFNRVTKTIDLHKDGIAFIQQQQKYLLSLQFHLWFMIYENYLFFMLLCSYPQFHLNFWKFWISFFYIYLYTMRNSSIYHVQRKCIIFNFVCHWLECLWECHSFTIRHLFNWCKPVSFYIPNDDVKDIEISNNWLTIALDIFRINTTRIRLIVNTSIKKVIKKH